VSATVWGPTRPQAGVQLPPGEVPALPWIVTVPADAGGWFVGVHGGSGASTMAALVAGSQATTGAWVAAGGAQLRVVLVCRSSLHGLTAARSAMTTWAAGSAPAGVTVMGLVVMADAPGRLPRPLGQALDVIAGGVPRCWRLPWVEAWRTSPTPTLSDLPSSAQHTLAQIASVVRAPARPSPQG
jgi:hypothetical protein